MKRWYDDAAKREAYRRMYGDGGTTRSYDETPNGDPWYWVTRKGERRRRTTSAQAARNVTPGDIIRTQDAKGLPFYEHVVAVQSTSSETRLACIAHIGGALREIVSLADQVYDVCRRT